MISSHINGLLYYKHPDELTALAHAQATAAALKGIAPQDTIEGMLAAQMVAVYKASMECLSRGLHPDQSAEVSHFNLNQANKLMRTYILLMESLENKRGKKISEQKVTVEHVHIHQGAQAVIGSLNQQGDPGQL